MKDFRRELIRLGITREQIENEMSWLRSIDMDSDKDVMRAAIEIKGAISDAKEKK